MRNPLFRACLIGAAALLVACAQQARRPEPAPVVEDSKPPVTATTPEPAPTPPPKPKPKPKPAPPKPETKDTDVTPAPATPAPDGLEQSQVGYYFDTLQGRLRQLADPNIIISRTDGHITVDITHRVQFDGEDAPLPAEQCSALAPIAKALVEYKMTRVVADIGADTADEDALKTAKSRANAVTKCLIDAGVAAHRLGVREVAMPSPRSVLRIEPIIK